MEIILGNTLKKGCEHMNVEEISIYDDTVYQLMEKLYELHQREWKQYILRWFAGEQSKNISIQTIKAHLIEVPELLIDRCLWELEHSEILEHIRFENELCYHLKKNNYVTQIMNELLENAKMSKENPLKYYERLVK